MSEISAIIIAKNEESKIRECLKSVAWADEIVLVDHFSEDATAEIAEKMGARVFREKWTGFATQKNSVLRKATKPWIFSIDADERVSPELRDEITGVVRNPAALDGYYVKRKNHFKGKWVRHGGWHPDFTLRLFKRGRGVFEERAVHEKVKIDGPCGHLENYLEHYTYNSISDYLRRLDVYSDLASLEISPRKSWTRWHNMTLRPFFTFFKMLVLRRGILDGGTGLFLAFSYSYYTYLKYYRFYERQDADEDAFEASRMVVDAGRWRA